MKQKPVRTCAICRQKKYKSEMIRIVAHPENGAVMDASGKMNGRGTYVCAESDCIQSSRARKQLASALKIDISDVQFESLKKRTEDHILYLKRIKTP